MWTILLACSSPTPSDTADKTPVVDTGDSPAATDSEEPADTDTGAPVDSEDSAADSPDDSPVDSPDDSPADTAQEPVDTDGDGVLDADELSGGTDPTNADSDGDGYGDGDELDAGTDPVDAASVPYVGGWPYNRDKDLLVEPTPGDACAVGTRIPRVVMPDQFGDAVDLYDFAGHGVPVVLQLVAAWNSWDMQLSMLLAGMPSTFDSYGYSMVDDPINGGKVYWITIIQWNTSGSLASAADAVKWSTAYPNDNIPVVADDAMTLWYECKTDAYPSLIRLDEDLVVQEWNKTDYTGVLDWMSTL